MMIRNKFSWLKANRNERLARNESKKIKRIPVAIRESR